MPVYDKLFHRLKNVKHKDRQMLNRLETHDGDIEDNDFEEFDGNLIFPIT